VAYDGSFAKGECMGAMKALFLQEAFVSGEIIDDLDFPGLGLEAGEYVLDYLRENGFGEGIEEVEGVETIQVFKVFCVG